MAAQTPDSSPERGNGLQTALNVIVAPREAFETLRLVPMWGWAFIIATVLGLIGSFLMAPAQQHAMHSIMVHQMATDANSAQLTDAQKEQRIAVVEKFAKFGIVFVPIIFLLASLIQALILLAFNALGKGIGTFKQFFAASMNITIISGLSILIAGILAMMKGPDAFNTTIDQWLTLPSLAWVLPNAAPKLVAILAQINPFTIWMFFLTAMMMMIIARVSKGVAYGAAFVPWLFAALIATLGAR